MPGSNIFSRAVIALFMFGLFGGLATLLTNPQEPDIPTAGFQIAWVFAYMLFLLIFVLEKQIYLGKVEIGLLCFGLYIVISTLWSKSFSSTVLYSFSVAVNFLFAIYMSRKYTLNSMLLYLAMFLTFYNSVGFLMYLLNIEQAFYIDPLDRGSIIGLELYKGLFSHKIYAGYYSAFAFFLSYHLLKGYKKFVFCGINLFLVLLSGSSLSIVFFIVFLFALITAVFIQRTSFKFSLSIATLYFISFASILVSVNYEAILYALGRDPTLTGRTDLWAWAVEFIERRPFFGWGYSGIFFDGDLSPSNAINDFSYYKAPHFHNSYLQIASELGLVGLLAFLFFYFRSLYSCIFIANNDLGENRRDSLLLFSFLIASMVIFTSMNIGLRYNEFMTFFIFYIYLSAAKVMRIQ